VGLLRACHVILDSAEQKIETLTRFNDAAQPVSATPASQTEDGVDGEVATIPAHDAATTPDLNSAKPSLF
jgi:hypothetical protein